MECVYLIDDKPSDLFLIRRLCEDVGLTTKSFECPSEFLEIITPEDTGCLVADLLMPEMSGLQLFEKLIARDIYLTTIIISGYADAGSCRAAFQKGVFDFIEKKTSPEELMRVIQRAFKENRTAVADRRLRDVTWRKIEELTNREMEVAQLLAKGNTLKEIGSSLGISVQTASKHRSSIFEKLDVTNEVALHRVFENCSILLSDASSASNPKTAIQPPKFEKFQKSTFQRG